MNLAAPSYLFAILITGLGILGQWGPEVLAGLWRWVAGVWVLLLLLEGVVARHRPLSIARQLPERFHLGVVEGYAITLHNPSQRPLVALGAERPPAGLALLTHPLEWRVAARGEATVAVSVRATQLGEQRFSDPLLLRLRGHLGLAWWSRRALGGSVGGCRVVPNRLSANERVRCAQQPVGERQQRRAGSGAELLWLRDYQPGDAVQSIDWKATARGRRPVVRVMAEEQHLELVLLVDVGRASAIQAGPLSRLGHYCNVAARLAEKALGHGDRVHLAAFADRVLVSAAGMRGAAGVVTARELLARLRAAEVASNPLPAVLEVRRLTRRRALVVLITDPQDGEAGQELVKATSLLRPHHQPLIVGITDPAVTALAQQPPSSWLDPFRSLAAQETSEGWRRISVRLQRLGAEVVLAPESRIDTLVLAGYERLRAHGRI